MAAGLRLSRPAQRTRRRSIIPTWPPPWRSRSRAARPTPASSSTVRGSGSAIAANKVRGIRAAMCVTPTLARYAREHNGANVLALGATLVSPEEALAIVETFLSTSMKEARYIARLAKVKRLEEL